MAPIRWQDLNQCWFTINVIQLSNAQGEFWNNSIIFHSKDVIICMDCRRHQGVDELIFQHMLHQVPCPWFLNLMSTIQINTQDKNRCKTAYDKRLNKVHFLTTQLYKDVITHPFLNFNGSLPKTSITIEAWWVITSQIKHTLQWM